MSAQYTIILGDLVNNLPEGESIFSAYPIFDENYRKELEQKIINHFYFREIGVETPGRFIFNLNTRLNEIMPSINKLYMSEALEQRILDNYDVTETFNKTGTDQTKRLFSDTPQTRVDLDGSGYVSEINDDSGTNTENWTRTMIGNIGVQTDADAVIKFRQSILNVDQELFKALNDLFMQVY